MLTNNELFTLAEANQIGMKKQPNNKSRSEQKPGNGFHSRNKSVTE